MRRRALSIPHLRRGFYHDGRFATLAAVLAHDDDLEMGLTAQQKRELVEYLESL